MRTKRPKPTFLRVIEGNPRDKPLNDSEPVPSGDLSDPPDWLSESQKDGWRFAIEHAPRGLLKQLDRSMLAIWVIAEDLHRNASIKIQKTSMLIKAPNTGTPIQSPYLAIVNKQANIMIKAAAELGFTPSSRSQIHVERGANNAFANNGRRLAR